MFDKGAVEKRIGEDKTIQLIRKVFAPLGIILAAGYLIVAIILLFY